MNVYKHLPVLEGENFKLRGVLYEDADDLLKVYSEFNYFRFAMVEEEEKISEI